MTGNVLASTGFGTPSGRPIVALHGALGAKERFGRIASEGIPQRRWICLDRRGYGDSGYISRFPRPSPSRGPLTFATLFQFVI